MPSIAPMPMTLPVASSTVTALRPTLPGPWPAERASSRTPAVPRPAPPAPSRATPAACLLIGSCLLAAPGGAVDAAPGARHSGQHAHHDMLRAGEAAMGFDQARASHHFRLRPDGGEIAIAVNDPADAGTRARIRTHLEELSRRFAAGDFSASRATHGEEPPGVATLQARREHVRYVFTATAAGGLVRITTRDPEARLALHAFLRYQIREHRTGDPARVEPRPPAGPAKAPPGGGGRR